MGAALQQKLAADLSKMTARLTHSFLQWSGELKTRGIPGGDLGGLESRDGFSRPREDS